MSANATTKQARDAANGKFNMGFLDGSGQGLGPFYAIHAGVDAGGKVINPSTDDTLSQVVAGLGSDGSNPPVLPGGSTGVRGWLRHMAGKIPAYGRAAMANALPVTIASDQPAIPVSSTVNGSPITSTNRMPVQIGGCDVPLTLPAGLAQDASLLALNALVGALGSNAPSLPGGSTGMTGLLRLIAATLSGNLAVSWTGQSVAVSNLPAVQQVSASALPLAPGASTSALQTTTNGALNQLHSDIGTTNASLGSILTTLQAQRAETLWTDDSGAYYVRADTGSTTAWYTPSGANSSGPGVGMRPAAGTTTLLSRSLFQASAGGAGYNANDYLDHFVTTDPGSGAVIGNFWINTTQSTAIAAPTAGTFSSVSPLPTGAATATLQNAGNASLTSIASSTASIANAIVAPTPAGNAVIGRVGLQVGGADVGPANAVPVSGSFFQATQPVSLSSVPLAANAAIASKQPALGTAGTAAADVITVQGIAGGLALPVSLASAPLAAGASTSALQTTANGTLSTINTGIGSTNTALGTVNSALAQLHADLIAPTPAGNLVIGRVGLQAGGADVTTANPLTVNQSGSTGLDFSANVPTLNLSASPPTIGGASTTLLSTMPVAPGRAAVEIQNQSTQTIYLVRDDGAGNNTTLLILSPPGAGVSAWTSRTFKGRIRVYGPANAQVGACQD